MKQIDKIHPAEIKRKEDAFFLLNRQKPAINKQILDKWKILLDPILEISGVKTCAVIILDREKSRVVAESTRIGFSIDDNLSSQGMCEVFSEAIVAMQDEMLVSNANECGPMYCDENTHSFEFVSYYGIPLNWKDNEPLGSLCVFDNKVNDFEKHTKDLLWNMKLHIETDLEVLLTKQLLEIKERTFQNSSGTKTKLLSLISHDIKGSIGTQNQFLKSRISRLEKYNDEQLKNIIRTLGQSVNATYLTLENLLTWAKNNVLQLKPNKKTLNIVDLINDILLFFDHSIQYKNLNVIKEFYDTKIPVLADKDMLEAAIRNIISNAIKYSLPMGMIYVRIKERHGEAIIEIEDQGIGMDQFTLNNLFKYDEEHQKSGTSGETSTGIGLMLCKELIEKNNARIEVESQYRKGSKFIIIM